MRGGGKRKYLEKRERMSHEGEGGALVISLNLIKKKKIFFFFFDHINIKKFNYKN